MKVDLDAVIHALKRKSAAFCKRAGTTLYSEGNYAYYWGMETLILYLQMLKRQRISAEKNSTGRQSN